MISIVVFFWFMVLFFTLIGYFRGWQKEVIALAGLVASIAALQQFGYQSANILADGFNWPRDSEAWRQQQFWIQAIFHLIIAFFSYQVVARLAATAAGGKLGARLRVTLEKGIIGALFGALNGYLVVGTLWSFLEYQMTADGYVRLAAGEPYVFSDHIIRPAEAMSMTLIQYLPMGLFTPTIWLILFFLVFFVVIIALI
jgi:uncharacterized membrane protein required for colicin V production